MSATNTPLGTLNFVPGQRWISNTESELGLGIVSTTDHRFVTVSFPAAAEQRVYAKNNAPLSRVQYRVGDTVNNSDGEQLWITGISDDEGYITYRGKLVANDEPGNWGEVELDCFVQFSKPQDRLFAGQIDRQREFRLRHQTLLHQQQLSSLGTTGLLGPRIQLLPHQLYIANEVGQRFAPRVLLADEVGLGKTIEAGLIIHQQLLCGLSQRVLILVPETLAHQWLVEMLRRFNLHFTLLDEGRAQAMEESGSENPFDDAQLILCSLGFITHSDKRLRQSMATEWDLLVVDEAHHLEWHPDQSTPDYDRIEQLSRVSSGLLLLTATPEQLGIESHFARLRLLDPDRYFDLDTFIAEQSEFSEVNGLVQTLVSDTPAETLLQDKVLLAALQKRLGSDIGQQLQQQSDDRQQVVEQLLDRHGTGRVLFRNTRAAVKGFPQRKLYQWPLNSGADDFSLADNPRVIWLVQWLKRHRLEKVLLICASADMALDLETHLNLRCGVRSAVFYEGLSLVERDRAAAYFADLEDGAQILVCSEIGSEGRNFQFAHHLVMFDLPLNPDLIEQRIGRLDRIGQAETVQIHLPYIEGSSEHKMLQWCHRGLNCFESVCPVGHQIFEEYSQQLLDCLYDDGDLEQLITATRQRTQNLLLEMSRGRDRLLELNSCRPAIAGQLVEALQSQDEDDKLVEFVQQAFEVYGIDHERHSDKAFVAHPSDHMQCEHFPGIGDDGITATYCRQQALSRDDIQFLTWEHPLVTGAMDMILNSELGNTAFCTLRLPPLQPGSLLVEALFQFTCPAPRKLQLQRFVESSCMRLLCDNELRALEKVVTAEHIDKLSQTVKKATAKQLLQHARPQLETIITHLEQQGQALLQDTVTQAVARMDAYYRREIQRLRALSEINPNIRVEELEYLEQAEQSSREYLDHAQLKLDAIRVAVVT